MPFMPDEAMTERKSAQAAGSDLDVANARLASEVVIVESNRSWCYAIGAQCGMIPDAEVHRRPPAGSLAP